MAQRAHQGRQERFMALYTAAVYDTLDEMGLPNQCLDLSIKPLAHDMKLAGPAFTVLGTTDPRDDDEYEHGQKTADWGIFDAIYQDCVVLVVANGERHCGHWGELMSTAAKARGAAGVVIDGGIRDGSLLFAIEEWPAFARYTSPIESKHRYRIRDLEVPVAASGTLSSQVRVDPGDWLFGDMDGVLVVPQGVVDEVLERSEEAKAIEDLVRIEIRQGAHVRDVYKKYGRL
jgi:4-hydroxy-4-methyl-2-oxoglutarate aldolase